MGEGLKDKKALVTGGSRGNGHAIALGLMKKGAKVVVFDKLKGNDDGIDYVEIDLLKTQLVEVEYSKASDNVGGFNILVNNAGITFGSPAEDYPFDKWNLTIGLNLTVPFVMSKLFAKDCISRGAEGTIINITSLGAEFGFPENPAYCASKGGLKQLTKALAYDWAQYGIRVNNVGPGYMHTNMTEKSYNDPEMNADRLGHMMIKRWGESEDLAGICSFLASDEAGYITGQDIYVDGGWTAKGL